VRVERWSGSQPARRSTDVTVDDCHRFTVGASLIREMLEGKGLYMCCWKHVPGARLVRSHPPPDRQHTRNCHTPQRFECPVRAVLGQPSLVQCASAAPKATMLRCQRRAGRLRSPRKFLQRERTRQTLCSTNQQNTSLFDNPAHAHHRRPRAAEDVTHSAGVWPCGIQTDTVQTSASPITEVGVGPHAATAS
jgi:hypothetical protein